MAHGRVVNIEFRSKDDLLMFRNKWSNWWPEKVTPVLSRSSSRTSENSLLLLATYEMKKKQKKLDKYLTFSSRKTQSTLTI